MLKASGVVLPAIKEAHNEGANTPEVAKGGNGSPRTGLRATKSPSKPGSALAPKAACLPEQLRGLMRVWGEWGGGGGREHLRWGDPTDYWLPACSNQDPDLGTRLKPAPCKPHFPTPSDVPLRQCSLPGLS